MHRHTVLHMLAALLLAALLAGAAPAPSAAAPPDPAAVATAYLQARGAAVTAPDAAAVLTPWLAPGSRLAATEALIARGAARRAVALGHFIDGVQTQVTIGQVAVTDGSATVSAHVITTVTWHAASGGCSVEATGIDHTVSLSLTGDAWRVLADSYSDTDTPACLEAAGAGAARVHSEALRLERAAHAPLARSATADAAAAGLRILARYVDVITYDRQACADYADRYALSYNPTYTSFSGVDCADFCSQCARAGGMPLASGGADSGWWYDKGGTNNPADDTYSLSWINVGKQMGYWNGRRTDWAASVSDVARGDFVYYDWTGDGSWDHVAVFAGTNSAGQKVVDAHTTDHSRVYWKMGSSATKYKFAHTRASWVVS